MKYKIPIISSLLYFVFSLVYLQVNGYHEDAYILFNYSENLANTGIISYYPDGPPSEGATDFLWMILISILYLFNIPTFLSVSILNSIGSFIVSYVIVSFLGSRLNTTPLLIISICWLFSLGVISSFSGFSTIFYNSVLLLSILSLYQKRTLVPYLLLLLSLIRPDGVIMSFGIFLITVFCRPFNSRFYKDYILGYLFSSIIGSVYFLWRWNYFGEILPLPLYVKSNSSDLIFPGLYSNLVFLKSNIYLVFLLFFVMIKSRKEHLTKYLPIIVPGIILFISLLFAHQSQNVGFRFQFPLWISCFLFLIILISENPLIIRNKYFALILFVTISFQSIKFYSNIYSSNQHYIDDFSINFLENSNNAFEKIKISLTEAGRFTYWLIPKKPVVIDLIGLNTKETSRETMNESFLESVDSDLIFIHHSGIINPKEKTKNNIFKVRNENEIESNINMPKGREDKVAYATLKFLKNNFNHYNIYLVDYRETGDFYHLFAFKKTSNLDSIFLKSVIPSFYQKRTFLEKLSIRENY